MYIMSIWGGSWGSGCCRRARFRRWRWRRRSYRSGTSTTKSGLACRLIWYIICPCRSYGFKKFANVPTGQNVDSRPSLREVKMKKKLQFIDFYPKIKNKPLPGHFDARNSLKNIGKGCPRHLDTFVGTLPWLL